MLHVFIREITNPASKREMIERILEALKNDQELSSYVKSFTAGEANVSRKLFPFVDVGSIHRDVIPYTIISNVFRYRIEILAGTKSLAPGTAYSGDDFGRKGIVQLKEDVESVIRGNHFDGTFRKLVETIDSRTGRQKDGSGAVQLALITFTGEMSVRMV